MDTKKNGAISTIMIGSISIIILGYALFFFKTKKVTLPPPSGEYAVGITAYHLIDKSRKEELSPNPEDYRELMVFVWYPADKKIKGELYPYLPKIMPYVKKLISQETHTSTEKLRYLDKIKTHSVYNCPISNSQAHYPLIFFSHGFGVGFVRMYTTLLEELASHGYIVVGIDHTYENLVTIFPDGRIITNEDIKVETHVCVVDEAQRVKMKARGLDWWVTDIQFVFDELEKINKHDPNEILTSKCDMTRIGVFGHSNGGAAAAQVCRRDSRFKAGIDIDGQIYGQDVEMSFDKPFMFLFGKTLMAGIYPSDEQLAQMNMTKADCDKLAKATLRPIENLFNNLAHDAYFIWVKKAGHSSFSDFNLLLPSKMPDTIDPLRGIEITQKLVLSFFDVYLKHGNPKLIIDTAKFYPEIIIKFK